MNKPHDISEFAIVPDPDDDRLSRAVTGIDQTGAEVEAHVVHERPLTIYLNRQEIVTAMTIGDHPDWLAVGYLLNQGMLKRTTRSRPSTMTTILKLSWCALSVRQISKRR
jgi:FdhD protein